MKRRFALVLASLALTAPAMAHAQDDVVADVPFKFMAAGKVHEAGTYTVRVADDMKLVELTPAKGHSAALLVETRLAEPPSRISQGRLVFDKVADTYTLSELWMPGDDGFLLHSTKEPHTHHMALLRKKAG